ncbi:MAG: D-Ala-D-Ala carboxypeptidase family metallohydrolase, partial [Acidobacteriota bacterium]
TAHVTDALLNPKSSSTVFIDDAALTFLSPLHGYSGKVNAVFRTPGSEIASEPPGSRASAELSSTGDADVAESPDFTAPDQPGIYDLAVQIDQARKQIDGLKIVTLVPFSEKRNQRIGLYYLGKWPFENGGQPKSRAYENPSGFIKVTRENRATQVSEHFRLEDFLTKDQPNVWPKYLLLSSNLLDKLELIIEDLNAHGYKVNHIMIMSGFRTPRYNAGGGNTEGRANLSRHMYGDASDIFVDNNGDRYTDDLNGDGKVNMKDAEIIAAAAERVERRYPSLVGGVGTYQACCGHGPFVHVDVRGYRARWRGTGNG